MPVEIPIDWSPPEKDHGGENLVEYFSMQYLNGVIAMILVETRAFDAPIMQDFDKVSMEIKAVDQRLKDNNSYFFGDQPSIYDHYKIMEQKAAQQAGFSTGETDLGRALIIGGSVLRSKFDRNMSTEDALVLSREIVETWPWNK